MDSTDRSFSAERIREGFTVSDCGQFLTGPATPAVIRGEAVLVRQCYEFEAGRWEGFVSLAKSTAALDAIIVDDMNAQPTKREPGRFGIVANRGGGSIFGAASAWSKGADGEPSRFDTMEAARTEAARLTSQIKSGNVWYVARAFAEGL